MVHLAHRQLTETYCVYHARFHVHMHAHANTQKPTLVPEQLMLHGAHKLFRSIISTYICMHTSHMLTLYVCVMGHKSHRHTSKLTS